jgi:hypothetical protein
MAPPFRSLRRVQRHARQPQHGQHVRVIPFKGHRKREDIEIGDRRLRLQRAEGRPAVELRLQFLLRRQEDALADSAVRNVEELIDRLKPEVRHAHPVGVRKGQRHPQPSRVDLADKPHLFRQRHLRALALFPICHG